MVIQYSSSQPERRVDYFPRTAHNEPSACTTIDNPNGHAEFIRDLQSNGNTVPKLAYTIITSGFSADVVANIWTRYGEVVHSIRESNNGHWRRWRPWAAGILAVNLSTTIVDQRTVILSALDREQHIIKENDPAQELHPIAWNMIGFLKAQLELSSLNGSAPDAAFLPAAALASPAEVVGIAALDLYSRQET